MPKPAKYQLLPILKSMNACEPAIAWLQHEKHPTFADAWNACGNLDWLEWVVCSLINADMPTKRATDGPLVRKWATWVRLSETTVLLDIFRTLFPADLVERALVSYARRKYCLVRT